MLNESCSNIPVHKEQMYGCKLIGMIPCSDQFGVNINAENYRDVLAKADQKPCGDIESHASPTKVFGAIPENQ